MFTPLQIDKVVEVCRDLLSSPSLAPGAVAARDIGVIAAFRKQVLKLRLALRQAGMSNVNVGSVEDFQVCAVMCILLFGVLCAVMECLLWRLQRRNSDAYICTNTFVNH